MHLGPNKWNQYCLFTFASKEVAMFSFVHGSKLEKEFDSGEQVLLVSLFIFIDNVFGANWKL